jgi:integrase
VKNREPLEHLLHDDAAALLDVYVEGYLPLLRTGPRRWLWPGENDRHKDPGPFRQQMKRFLREHVGIDFHPHLVRKVVTKILLDDDPGAIEIARRCFGHRDDRTTRKAYTQKQNRAAHERYLKALDQRRLGAIRAFGGSVK